MRVSYSVEAEDDLRGVARFIVEGGGEREVARRFVGGLRSKVVELAGLPFVVGRLRPEIKPDLRSYAHGRYVIFFYAGDDVFRVMAVIEGHRDLRGLFG